MKLPKPPKKIRVGYKTYKVERIESFGTSGQLGKCNPHTSTIQYKETESPVENANTVLHETLHAIFYVYGMKEHDLMEEYVVNTLTNGLINVLQENPKLLTFIEESIHE